MRKIVSLFVAVLLVLGFLLACAQPTPTAAPTKPAASAATTAPAPAATTASAVAATKPAAAATSAPVATKPVAAAPTITTTAKIKRGGRIITARYTTFADFDPHRSTSSISPVTKMIYEPLLDYNLVDQKTGKHELAPELAVSWKVVDPKTIEFSLRKGVKFQDGSEWNAEIAKWNLERMRDDKKSAGKALVSEIDQVEAVDTSTIRLKLKAPWATLLVNLTASTGGTGSMASVMASKAAVDKGGDEILSTKPVGTGPMMIEQWIRDDRVVLKSWGGYWKQGEDGQPLPYLEGMTERHIPDMSVTLVELRSGNVHSADDLEAKDVASIKANPDLVYLDLPWASMAHFTFGFNQEGGSFQGNRKLAYAAQHALDREAMAKAIGFGLATPAYYVVWTPALAGYSESLPKFQFDPAKSKQLITEAGYPTGVDINLLTSTRQPEQRIAEIVKQMWDTVGIRTSLDVMETLATRAKVQAKDFDVYFWRQGASPDPDLQSRMLVCGRPSNWSNYCNPEVDKCMAEGRSAYATQERQQIYEKCIRIIQEDGYIGSGFFLPTNNVHQKYVKGLKVHWASMDYREAWLDK
jgi:peptide/nickel transport system substrate-binding protein